MSKITYRFEEEQNKFDTPILVTRPDIGKVTAMSLGGAHHGLPQTIRKDEVVLDYKTNHLYVQGPGGITLNLSDVSILNNLSERPTVGVEDHLYILLRENMFSVWTDNHWKDMATSDVQINQYDGVEVYDSVNDMPAEGKENKLYMTQKNQGFRWVDAEKKYKLLFGDNSWAYSKEAADATFARKEDIPVLQTLDELGGITPAEVNRLIQEEHDTAAQTYATREENDEKADKKDVYTKDEVKTNFAGIDMVKSLAQMGGASQTYVNDTFFTKQDAEALKVRVKKTEDGVNSLSEYRKTVDTDQVIDNKIEEVRQDLTQYLKKDEAEKELLKKIDRASTYTKEQATEKFVPKTDFNLETLGAASKESLEPLATKEELKTEITAEQKRTYSQSEVDAKVKTVNDALESYKEQTAADRYTKAETDAAIKAFTPEGGWGKYEEQAHAEETYATKTELSAKAFSSDVYTKKQVDQRIADIVKTGKDMEGILMEDHDDTNQYIDKRIQDYVDPKIVDVPKFVPRNKLLQVLIEEDKKNRAALVFQYFATEEELNEIRRKSSRWVTERLKIEENESGEKYALLTSRVLVREELELRHNPIRIYINGIRYFENDDFTYDTETKTVTWKKENLQDVNDKLSGSTVYAEYEIETII